MTISESPLGMHLHRANLALQYLRDLPVKPRACGVMDNIDWCGEVKAIDPRVTTIMRYTVSDADNYIMQGEAGGVRFVNERPWQNADIAKGLNEVTGFNEPAKLDKVVQFNVGFARACAAIHVRPAVLSLAVGNPHPDLFARLLPAVQAAQAAGGYVDYRPYGPVDLFYDTGNFIGRWHESILPALRTAGLVGDVGVLGGEGGWDTVFYGNHPIADGPWRKLLSQGALSHASIQGQLVAYARYMDAHDYAHMLLYDWYAWNGTDDVYYDFARDAVMREWYAQHLAEYRRVAPPVPPVPPPPPPPPALRRVVWPGASYGSAWLRNSPDWADHLVTAARGTQVTVAEDTGEWLRIECWIPKALTRLV